MKVARLLELNLHPIDKERLHADGYECNYGKHSDEHFKSVDGLDLLVPIRKPDKPDILQYSKDEWKSTVNGSPLSDLSENAVNSPLTVLNPNYVGFTENDLQSLDFHVYDSFKQLNEDYNRQIAAKPNRSKYRELAKETCAKIPAVSNDRNDVHCIRSFASPVSYKCGNIISSQEEPREGPEVENPTENRLNRKDINDFKNLLLSKKLTVDYAAISAGAGSGGVDVSPELNSQFSAYRNLYNKFDNADCQPSVNEDSVNEIPRHYFNKLVDAYLSSVTEDIHSSFSQYRTAPNEKDTLHQQSWSKLESSSNTEKHFVSAVKNPFHFSQSYASLTSTRQQRKEHALRDDIYKEDVDFGGTDYCYRNVQRDNQRRNGSEELKEKLSFLSNNEEYIYDEPGNKPLKEISSFQDKLQNGLGLYFSSRASDSNFNRYNNEQSNNKIDSPISLPPTFCRDFNNSSWTTSSKNDYCSLTTSRRSRVVFDKAALEISVSNNKLEADFCTHQNELKSDARLALNRAQQEAKKVLETERCRNSSSPITAMLRASLKKVGMDIGEKKRRVSRQLLTDMNINQLQSIVNDLQNHIEHLNESLVKLLMERDELYMKQDSMLVDIEDITRYMEGKYKFVNYGKVSNKNKYRSANIMYAKANTNINRIANFIKS